MKNITTLAGHGSKKSNPASANANHYINVAGVRARYVEEGRGNPGPPLILLHGFQAGADYWLPYTLPALASEHHTIALDLPGFGYSTRLAEPGLSSYARFIGSFIDALGFEKIDLLGHSMGGEVAIATAAAYSHRINNLVLVDSAGLPRSSPEWRVPLQMFSDASSRHWRLYPLMLRLGARATALRDGLDILRHEDVTDLLARLTMPTLVVWGSRDRIVPLEHGAFMAKRIPNARLALIRGAGHMPFYQKPAQFNRIVLGFLRHVSKT